jgi:hypothetical protein
MLVEGAGEASPESPTSRVIAEIGKAKTYHGGRSRDTEDGQSIQDGVIRDRKGKTAEGSVGMKSRKPTPIWDELG